MSRAGFSGGIDRDAPCHAHPSGVAPASRLDGWRRIEVRSPDRNLTLDMTHVRGRTLRGAARQFQAPPPP